MTVNLEDAYLTLYAGQDYVDAIARILRIADPTSRTHFEPSGRTIPTLVYMESERNWLWDAAELAAAIGLQLKHLPGGTWILAPATGSPYWEFYH